MGKDTHAVYKRFTEEREKWRTKSNVTNLIQIKKKIIYLGAYTNKFMNKVYYVQNHM